MELITEHQDIATFIITSIVAAIFREFEKRHMKRKHKKEIEDLKNAGK